MRFTDGGQQHQQQGFWTGSPQHPACSIQFDPAQQPLLRPSRPLAAAKIYWAHSVNRFERIRLHLIQVEDPTLSEEEGNLLP